MNILRAMVLIGGFFITNASRSVGAMDAPISQRFTPEQLEQIRGIFREEVASLRAIVEAAEAGASAVGAPAQDSLGLFGEAQRVVNDTRADMALLVAHAVTHAGDALKKKEQEGITAMKEKAQEEWQKLAAWRKGHHYIDQLIRILWFIPDHAIVHNRMITAKILGIVVLLNYFGWCPSIVGFVINSPEKSSLLE